MLWNTITWSSGYGWLKIVCRINCLKNDAIRLLDCTLFPLWCQSYKKGNLCFHILRHDNIFSKFECVALRHNKYHYHTSFKILHVRADWLGRNRLMPKITLGKTMRELEERLAGVAANGNQFQYLMIMYANLLLWFLQVWWSGLTVDSFSPGLLENV